MLLLSTVIITLVALYIWGDFKREWEYVERVDSQTYQCYDDTYED